MSSPEHGWIGDRPGDLSDGEVIDAFIRGAVEGASQNLQIEDQALAVRAGLPPYWAVLARIERGVYLLREDPPGEEEARAREVVRAALGEAGLHLVDLDEPGFNRVAGMIVVGARIADWELWADRDEHAQDALRRTLMGEMEIGPVGSPDAAPGMTLDELLGVDDELRDLDRRLDRLAERLQRRDGEGGDDDPGAAGSSP